MLLYVGVKIWNLLFDLNNKHSGEMETGRDNHRRFSFLVVVLCSLLFYFLSQMSSYLIRYFSAINVSFENTAASPRGSGGRAIYVYRGGSKWSSSECVPCSRAGLRCCAGCGAVRDAACAAAAAHNTRCRHHSWKRSTTKFSQSWRRPLLKALSLLKAATTAFTSNVIKELVH